MRSFSLPMIAVTIALAAAPALAQTSQTKAQARGDYGAIDSSYLKPAGLIQKAWDRPNENKASNQDTPGYTRYDYLPDKIIPIRLREAMNTTIRFPADETIEDVYVSDPVGFEALVPRGNVIMVRAIRPGADADLTAFGQSGRLYKFYLRGEGANTKSITDMMVDIMVANRPNRAGAATGSAGALGRGGASDFTVEADWLRRIGFKPENVAHDLSIWVPEDDSAGIAPERVFRDGQFTYIDYGSNADALNEWPVAALVVQGVETPVNTRVAGPNGRMLVVEAVGNIVLRNGRKIVCIKQAGKGATSLPPAPRRANQQVVDGRRRPVDADGVPNVSSPSTGRKYLVDLGSGSRGQMERQWATIKAQQSTLLGSSSAEYPDATAIKTGGTLAMTSRAGDVRLRVGPFYSLGEGVRVCKAITGSGLPCAIVSAN